MSLSVVCCTRDRLTRLTPEGMMMMMMTIIIIIIIIMSVMFLNIPACVKEKWPLKDENGC